jgi:hypothetical protein
MSPRHAVYDATLNQARDTLLDVAPEVTPRSPYARRMEDYLEQIVADRASGMQWEDVGKKYFPKSRRPDPRTLRRLFAAFRKAGKISPN